MGHLLGYARVSTVLQDDALQTDALTAAGVVRIYTDKVSTRRIERRPQLDALLERADAGDTIVVWRLDRLARSLRELIDLTNDLAQRDIGLRSLLAAPTPPLPAAACCSTSWDRRVRT